MTSALKATEVFGRGASEFGLASTLMAVGSVSGALLAARRAMPTRRLLYGAVLVFGVLEVLVGLMPTWPAFLLMLVPAGLVLMTFTTAANATMQLGVSAEMRGRVMGLYMLVFMGTNPIASPLVGWIAEAFGARSAIVLGGAVAIATASVVLAYPRIRRETVVASA